MTDQQLYLAIGVPILTNAAMMLLGFTLLSSHFNKRIDDLRSEMIARFEALEKLFG
jgi:hypothetical protein